jgi:hypothetical protein
MAGLHASSRDNGLAQVAADVEGRVWAVVPALNGMAADTISPLAPDCRIVRFSGQPMDAESVPSIPDPSAGTCP